MIRGTVNSKLVALVNLEVLGSNSSAVRIEAEIDTGFSGFLALDRRVMDALRLPKVGVIDGTLADGNTTRFDTYVATVDWHGAVRTVTVIESDGGHLLGTALLKDSRLTIEVRANGSVSIERL